MLLEKSTDWKSAEAEINRDYARETGHIVLEAVVLPEASDDSVRITAHDDSVRITMEDSVRITAQNELALAG